MFIKCFFLLQAINFLSAEPVFQPEERISGGNSIRIEQAPWQVLLLIQKQQICGGSIYSKDIIVTAAHCLFTIGEERLEPKDLLIRAGSTFIDFGGDLIEVAALKYHEEFNFITKRNDIGIVRLSKPLQFSKKVWPIPLAGVNPPSGTFAFSTGWGATSVTSNTPRKYPRNLQGIVVPIHKCIGLHDDYICAGNFNKAACFGDSGGPLVVDQKLVGVVSIVYGTCTATSSYISVPFFKKWILNAINSI
ncbi:trypsin alpha [Drosophila eugracilis]|uniref:trypsin alpha n=1 Tax=Drosophila eugracilis TaxID=29029 RepID=UPI0007E89E32|nr:trypsin alpha [Drosophila eugracilis]